MSKVIMNDHKFIVIMNVKSDIPKVMN